MKSPAAGRRIKGLAIEDQRPKTGVTLVKKQRPATSEAAGR